MKVSPFPLDEIEKNPEEHSTLEQKEEKKDSEKIALSICIDDQPVEAQVNQQV